MNFPSRRPIPPGGFFRPMDPDSPAANRFLDLVTRPLEGNAELHVAARADLARRIAASPDANEDALEAAAERLERQRPWHKWGLRVLAVAAALAAGVVVLWGALGAWRAASIFYSLGLFGAPLNPTFLESPEYATYPAITDPRTRLILFGDETEDEPAGKWHVLWQSDPTNPVYFANYVGAWQRTHGEVSDELLAEAEKIDGDNGWYLAFAAGSRLDDRVLERQQQSSVDRRAREREEYKILDQAEYDIARDLFYRAAAKETFSDHSKDLYAERISLFPPAEDLLSNIRNISFMAGQASNAIPMRKIVNMIAHEADRCVVEEDEERFRQVVNAWRWFVDGLNRSSTSLVELLVTKVVVSAPLRNFRDAAGHFGMEEEAEVFRQLDVELEDDKLARTIRRVPDAEEALPRGSLLAGLSIPLIAKQVKSPVPLPRDDLRPGRLADHSVIGSILSGTLSFLLLLASGLVVWVRFRHGPYGRRVSESLCTLPRPGDWLAMFGFGVVAPLVWFLAVTRLTPLSSREWSVVHANAWPWVGQWAGLALLIFTASACAAAWRLDRRLRFLGRMSKSAWFGVAAAACAALAIPVSGSAALDPDGRAGWFAALGLAGVVVLWWFAAGFAIATGYPGEGGLRRVSVSRLLVPLWSAGALVFAAFSYLHRVEERHWVKQDRLLEIVPDVLGLTAYETQVTEQLREELAEVIARIPEL